MNLFKLAYILAIYGATRSLRFKYWILKDNLIRGIGEGYTREEADRIATNNLILNVSLPVILDTHLSSTPHPCRTTTLVNRQT
jgi:hypothetical protein